ncbi:MAG: DUF262 domain-containing HNH endonuclease family protein [Phycisphaerae bacterium]|nr:DUF262 domain-containing HNH endonuclease family protein [Phycisphaerae bacterium]MDD5380319.1 DUF262 domain-containing HNH endonuclease family protein [Phycisphaerae bacterium]
MGNSFVPRPATIGSLLGNNERRSVVLPRFQRGFSWENSQIATFWDDLLVFKGLFDADRVSATYFLGPIVLQEEDQTITLLDGQQRLATATILLSCLRDIARQLDDSSNHTGADLARDIQREFVEKEDTLPVQYSLNLGELDETFFMQTVKLDSPINLTPTLRSHHLIQSAYKFLYDKVAYLVKDKPLIESIQILKGLRDCLTKGMNMVAIVVQSEEDAYSIFETLNDRGLRLSVPDLLLNLLMQKAGNQGNRDRVRERWNYMLQQMGRRDISRFLRHMWLSMYGDLKARGLFAEMKNHLISQGIESLSFAEMCAQECDNYISILDIDNDIPKDARESVEGLVKNLNATSSFPLLLAGLACLNDNDFVKLSESIIALFIRHSVLSNLNPSDLETALYAAARELRGKKSTKERSAKCLSAAKDILARINPQDATVQENAKDVELNRKQAIWLMTNLAKAMQSETKEIGFDRVNLEHIFPLNAGGDWPNRKNLAPFAWKIGNLTILGTKLNNDAKNKGFAEKCRNYYSVSEVTITSELTKYSQWTEGEIIARGEELVKKMTQIWIGP